MPKQAIRSYLVERHRLVINLFAGLAALLVIFNIATSNVPEAFPYGAELSLLGYDAGLAYLTAWAFHELVIVVPETMRARRINDAVAPQVDQLITIGHQAAEGLARAAEQRPAFPISDVVVAQAVEIGKPTADFPGWHGSWLAVLDQLTRQATTVRPGLRPFYTSIPDNLLNLLLQEERDASLLSARVRGIRVLRKDHMRDVEAPLASWLACIAAIADMRDTVISPGRSAPEFSPREGMTLIPLDQIQKDYESIGITYEA